MSIKYNIFTPYVYLLGFMTTTCISIAYDVYVNYKAKSSVKTSEKVKNV